MKKPISRLANGSLLTLMTLVPTAASAADDQARVDTMRLGAAENVANLDLATAVVGSPREWSVSIKRRF